MRLYYEVMIANIEIYEVMKRLEKKHKSFASLHKLRYDRIYSAAYGIKFVKICFIFGFR